MQKKGEKAVIAFYDRQKRILLQDRFGISKAGEVWGFFGGSIEAGETPEQALKREIREELNFKLKEFEFLTKYKVFLPDKEFYNDVWLFIGQLDVDFQIMEQKEGRAMKWFTIDEAKKLFIGDTDINVIEQIEKYLADK